MVEEVRKKDRQKELFLRVLFVYAILQLQKDHREYFHSEHLHQ